MGAGGSRPQLKSSPHMSTSSPLTLHAPSLDATHAIAAALAGISRAGDVVVLAGEMGAGKTAFAQGFGRAIGIVEPITSPTFTLVHTYESPLVTLHHADIYRLEQYAEVADLALGELAEYDGIVLIEWGDVISAVLGDHLEVRLEMPDHGARPDSTDLTTPDDPPDDDLAVPVERRISVRPNGALWATRWSVVERTLSPWVAAC
jgi:tRNA threonylcarbamoyladenosine biosynthesis protein TsaE